jgi:hypothetical protein
MGFDLKNSWRTKDNARIQKCTSLSVPVVVLHFTRSCQQLAMSDDDLPRQCRLRLCRCRAGALHCRNIPRDMSVSAYVRMRKVILVYGT